MTGEDEHFEVAADKELAGHDCAGVRILLKELYFPIQS